MVPRGNLDMVRESHELCQQSAKLWALTEQVIMEAQETIKASKAVINRLNQSDHRWLGISAT